MTVINNPKSINRRNKIILFSMVFSLFCSAICLPVAAQPTGKYQTTLSNSMPKSEMRALFETTLDKYIRLQQDVDFESFLQQQEPQINIPNSIPINDDFSKLPAPPNQSFEKTLKAFDNIAPSPYGMIWFPQENVGALINTQGTAACSFWFFYSLKAGQASQIKTPVIFRVPFKTLPSARAGI